MDSKEIPEKELPGIIDAWRQASPRITKFWKMQTRSKASSETGEPYELDKAILNSLNRRLPVHRITVRAKTCLRKT